MTDTERLRGLVERLRARTPVRSSYLYGDEGSRSINPGGHEAATEIEALLGRIAALEAEVERAQYNERVGLEHALTAEKRLSEAEKVLRPLAAACDFFDSGPADRMARISLKDLRAARAFISKGADNG